MAHRAVVVGAAGFLGARLTSLLLGNDFDVIALNHGVGSADALRRLSTLDGVAGMVSITGDRNDPALLKALMALAPDIWLDTAPHSASSADRLLGAVQRGCPTRFVFTGSIAEHDLAVRPLAPIGPTTPLAPEDDLARKNVSASLLFADAAVRGGFDHVWAVLPQLWGPGDRSGRLKSWASAIAGDQGVLIRGNGRTVLPDGFVDTIAGALVHLAISRGGPNGRVPVAGPVSLLPRAFVEEAIRALGSQSTVVFADPSVIERVFGAGGCSYRSPLVDFDLSLDTELLEQSGFRAPVDWRAGVAVTATWLRDNPGPPDPELKQIRALETEVVKLVQGG